MLKLIKILLPTILTLILIEAILWLGFPQGNQPAIDIEMTQDIPGLSPTVHFQKNHLGLRTHSIHSFKKEPGTYRIIILGASTAEQATHSNDKTWGLLLEKHLQQALPDQNIEVGIFATGGTKTHELLRWCHRQLPKLQPDLLITLLGINNLATDRLFLETNSQNSLLASIEQQSTPIERLSEHSQIARYLRNIRNNNERLNYTKENQGANFDVAGLSHFRNQYWQTPLQHHPEAFPTELFTAQCRWLFTTLDQLQIPSLTLTQPALFKPALDYQQNHDQIKLLQPSSPASNQNHLTELQSLWFLVNTANGLTRYQPSHMQAALNRLNEAQTTLASKHQRATFPLHEKFPSNNLHFFDDCHFTDQGSEVLAEMIAPAVLKLITPP